MYELRILNLRIGVTRALVDFGYSVIWLHEDSKVDSASRVRQERMWHCMVVCVS